MRDSEKRKNRAGRGVWSRGLGRLGVRAGWGFRTREQRLRRRVGAECGRPGRGRREAQRIGSGAWGVVEGEDSAASSRTQPPPLKRTVPWLFVCSQSHATIAANPRIFPTPERKPAPSPAPEHSAAFSPGVSPSRHLTDAAPSRLRPLCLAPPTELEALGVPHAPSLRG